METTVIPKILSLAISFSHCPTNDFGAITIEFDEDITIDLAKQKAKDLVDGVVSSADWPTFNSAKVEPSIFEMDFSELMPILSVSLIGDYPIEELKMHAEYLENRIEQLPEIKSVDIRGIQDFEVEIAVDIYKMTASKISFNDIMNSIGGENATISAGNIIADGQRSSLRVIGEIKDPQELKNFGNSDAGMKVIDAIMLTTETVPNLNITKRIEIVTAECAFGMNIFKDLFAGIRDIVGGRSEAVQKSMRDSRKTVLYELKKEAYEVGANAVVGVDLDYVELSSAGSMVMLVASGTAVVIED